MCRSDAFAFFGYLYHTTNCYESASESFEKFSVPDYAGSNEEKTMFSLAIVGALHDHILVLAVQIIEIGMTV